MTARQLAADHVSVVHSLAKCFRGAIPHEDLCGIGYVALVEAANKFGKFRRKYPSCKFKDYAAQRVKWRMLSAIKRHRIENGETDEEPEASSTDDYSHEHIRGLIRRLPQSERGAIRCIYGIGRRKLSLSEFAARKRLSMHDARALVQSAIMRLRWDAVKGKV